MAAAGYDPLAAEHIGRRRPEYTSRSHDVAPPFTP
jgi:hypothetical protein